MKPTDTSELGLERLTVRHLSDVSEHPPVVSNTVQGLVSSRERGARGMLPSKKEGGTGGKES